MKVWSLISVMVLLGILAGCVEKETIETYGSEHTIYFANLGLTSHVPVAVDLEQVETVDQVKAILTMLKEGFKDNGFVTTIPEHVRILNVSVVGEDVIIDFSKEYTAMNSSITEMICRASIVKSIVELEAVNRVEFKVEGIPLKDSEGTVIGPMRNQDIIIDIKEEISGGEEVTLTVYFADKKGEYLIPEQRTVKLNPDLGYEKMILELLTQGPEHKDLARTVPEGTVVKDVYVRNGICYVDLNEAFVTSHMGGSAGETLTVFSIVNSLAERPNIRKVQFLIEGEIKAVFKGHFDFNITFEPDWDLVQKE